MYIDKMENEVYERDVQFDEYFSNFINGGVCSMKDTAEMMAKDHRYLVNEKFKLFMMFVENLAKNYDNGWYDGRNEWACKSAKAIMESLQEKELYWPHLDY